MMTAALTSAAIAGFILVAIAVLVLLRRRKEAMDARLLQASIAAGQHIPPSLHPIIDPAKCIGSFSCIRACPEGDILGIIDGKAALVEASHCIGHSRCAVECPVDAITLVFGSKEKGVDLPENDESFESSRPGVFIIGELGGMGLIKNAFRQGMDVADSLAARKASADKGDAGTDVVIVGAGPAGVACAVACKKLGLSAVCVEQEDSLGGTIAHYPRGKVVMTEQVVLPFYGKFGKPLISKEELVENLQKLLSMAEVSIRTSTKVTGIEGAQGAFTVNTSTGPLSARFVVLAIGLRGSPRKLGVPGEDRPKVIYRLIDPEQFHERRVLVVGGGDSAVEAAIQLAQESTAKVTISYRQESFSRCKPRNRQIIQSLIDEGRVRALLPSEVQSIHDSYVVMKVGEETARLKNDDVIVSVGGELPTGFLKSAGVSVKRFQGEAKGPVQSAEAPRGPSKAELERRKNRRFAALLTLLGVVVVAALAAVGFDYYVLPLAERAESPLHEMMRPAGAWGHGVGVVSTLFMLTTLSYSIRKRYRRLKGTLSIQRALIFHVFAGTLSPILIAFHAAFLANNMLALWTWAALGIVVATGVFGRIMLPWVPSVEGKLMSFDAVRQRLGDLEKEIAPRFAQSMSPPFVQALFSAARTTALPENFFQAVRKLPKLQRETKEALAQARSFFSDATLFERLSESIVALQRAKFHLLFYREMRVVSKYWLIIHVVLSVFMLILLTLHVAVTLYLGYRWIFSAVEP